MTDAVDRGTASRHEIVVVAADALDDDVRAEIVSLCERAYAEDFSRLFELLPGSVHVLARDATGSLVSHAAWVTRWLQPGSCPALRTAYVEAVATEPSLQGRGLAVAVLGRLASAVKEQGFELAALSPSEGSFYERLGWELWTGPLAIRGEQGSIASSADEELMILRLPRTPPGLVGTELMTAEWREGELW